MIDLVKGETYDFRVTSLNDVSVGDAPVTTQYTAVFRPAAPVLTDAAEGVKTQVTDYHVVWTKPDNGGSAIVEYKVYYTNHLSETIERIEEGANTLEDDFNGLQLGNHKFQVSAVNTIDGQKYEGPKSDELTVSIVSKPGAPTDLKMIARDSVTGTFTLGWNEPTNDGNDALTEYKLMITKGDEAEVEYDPAPAGSDLQTVVASVEKDLIYHFKLYAQNSQGYSDAYDELTDMTLQKPGYVTHLTNKEIHPTYVILEWGAPASQGDNEITEYRVKSSKIVDGVATVLPDAVDPDTEKFTYQIDGDEGETFEYEVMAFNGVEGHF